MIDPTDVTKFDRTDAELQEWWLFGTVAAGKTASTQARLLQEFFDLTRRGDETPFETIASYPETTITEPLSGRYTLDPLEDYMRRARLGQYRRLVRCWRESLALDLRNDPVEAFEAIHGVCPKTARLFILHSRPAQRLAAIDTHVLKHLAVNGCVVPKATPPSGKLYRALEQEFLKLAEASGMTVADYDLQVWKSYAKTPKI